MNITELPRFVGVIRKGSTAMTAEKKEEYIKTVTRIVTE